LVGEFWGLKTDCILQPLLQKVALSENGSPHGEKSLEIYQHLSLDAIKQPYQEAVQGVSI